jgi:hypothetical protein
MENLPISDGRARRGRRDWTKWRIEGSETGQCRDRDGWTKSPCAGQVSVVLCAVLLEVAGRN